jgi:acetyl-CoA acetyltransferase
MMTALAQARIVGAATTEQSRDLSRRSGMSLALEALRNAADDAGIDISEIDGISSFVSDWPYGATAAPGAPAPPQEFYWARQLGRPLHYLQPNRAVPAVLDAALAIDAGLASTVAIVVGRSRSKDPGKTAAWSRSSNEFTEWTGSYTTVQYALVAQRYMHEYGDAALQAMAQVSATIRNYGSINPEAVYAGRGPFTPDDILASRAIASPLTMLMCSSVNDGGAALILTSKERAADTKKRPVGIMAGGNQQPYAPYYEAPVLDEVADEGRFAREAFARAGIRVDDIDVVSLYDHFSIGVLLEYEMFGFCGRGEAADFIGTGAMELGGAFPTCTDGGLHSHSHNGAPQILRVIEGVRQLRGEAPDPCTAAGRPHSHVAGECRLVRDAELAFISNPGPPTGGAAFAVLNRS